MINPVFRRIEIVGQLKVVAEDFFSTSVYEPSLPPIQANISYLPGSVNSLLDHFNQDPRVAARFLAQQMNGNIAVFQGCTALPGGTSNRTP